MRLDKTKIEQIVAQRQMKITELSNKYGSSTANFYRILNAKKIYPRTAGKLAEALGVQVTDIIIHEEAQQ